MHHSLQIMLILSLMTGHLFWKATILGGLYRGVLLYIKIIGYLYSGSSSDHQVDLSHLILGLA